MGSPHVTTALSNLAEPNERETFPFPLPSATFGLEVTEHVPVDGDVAVIANAFSRPIAHGLMKDVDTPEKASTGHNGSAPRLLLPQ